MGTRGTVRIIVNGKIICIFVHWDSYPDHLGMFLLCELIYLLKNFSMNELRKDFFQIRLIDLDFDESKFKPNQKYASLIITDQSLNEKYGLTKSQCIREAQHYQGSLIQTLMCGYVYEDGSYEEYNYIIDFDKSKFKCKEAGWNINLDIKSLQNKIRIRTLKEMYSYLLNILIKNNIVDKKNVKLINERVKSIQDALIMNIIINLSVDHLMSNIKLTSTMINKKLVQKKYMNDFINCHLIK